MAPSKKKAAKRKKGANILAGLGPDKIELLAVQTEEEVVEFIRHGRKLLADKRDAASARKLITAAQRAVSAQKKKGK